MIRGAEEKDIPSIMNFIDTNWKTGHILGNNREFFEYEFVRGGKVNFVISEDDFGEINGIEGYIVYSSEESCAFLVMWKTIRGNNPMLGIEILQYIMNNTNVHSVASLGINQNSIGIYQYLGLSTGTMVQWHRLNPETDYVIASIQDYEVLPVLAKQTGRLCHFNNFSELSQNFSFEHYYASNPKLRKEAWYIEKRYFKHPIYQYHVYGIKTESETDSFIVFRIQEFNGHRVLRLVDVVGNYNRLYGVTEEIDLLMKQYDAEYVDCYEVGLPENEMERAGWKKVKGSGNIIPNYFSPFVQENIEIYYMSQDADMIFFKADGDQDRPN